ncbi:thermonuclease family protein, partial [Magnetospirillum fulvum]
MKTIALLSLVLAHGIFSGLVWADSPGVGRVQWVIDGDTVQISHAGAPEGEPVRARHFDTPEKGPKAHCEAERVKARQATALARSLLPRGSRVGLADFGRDRYGRLLARVTLADGRDLAAQMIEAGL